MEQRPPRRSTARQSAKYSPPRYADEPSNKRSRHPFFKDSDEMSIDGTVNDNILDDDDDVIIEDLDTNKPPSKPCNNDQPTDPDDI